MMKSPTKRGKGNDDIDDKIFLIQIGKFLKKMRLAAGFTSIRSFVDTFNISYSQYQGYESGKNITVLTLKKILNEFNLKAKDWLNLNLESLTENEELLIISLRQARVDQVIEQVKKIESDSFDLGLGTKEIQRYIDILIYCHSAKSRKEILTKLLRMDDSVNTLKRVAGKLIDYGWLQLTDPNNRNNPNQKYITSSLGKDVLSLRK